MTHVPSPTEILQRIIDEAGSCNWAVDERDASNFHYICANCPISQLYRFPGHDSFRGCIHSVARRTGCAKPTDREYKQVAIQLFEDLEIDNLLTKEKVKDRE